MVNIQKSLQGGQPKIIKPGRKLLRNVQKKTKKNKRFYRVVQTIGVRGLFFIPKECIKGSEKCYTKELSKNPSGLFSS